jgi:hypothetical protein
MGQTFGGDTTYDDGMMGEMMRKSTSGVATNSSVPYFGALFATLIGGYCGINNRSSLLYSLSSN